MKKYYLFIFIIFYLNSPVSSAQSNQRYQQGNINKTDQKAEELKLELIKIPEIKKVVTKCQKETPDDVSSCVWLEVQDNPKLKKLVNQKMEILKGGNNYEKSESLSIYKKDRKKSLILEKMEDYFSKKLKESLHGVTIKDGNESSMTTATGHNVYYKLAKTQLGKSIILSISSYCIEASKDNSYRIPNDKAYRLKTKKDNMQNLTKQTAPDLKTGETNIEAYNSWSSCYNILPQICYAPTNLSQEHLSSLPAETTDDVFSKESEWTPKKLTNHTTALDEENGLEHLAYTRMRACEVVNYMEKARLEIIALANLEKKMKVFFEDKSQEFNLKIKDSTGNERALLLYSEKLKDKGIDDILTTSSKDFSQAHKEGREAELKEFEKCATIDNKDGATKFEGVDAKACERYLSRSNKNHQERITQDLLKFKMQAKHIKELSKDKEGLEQILEEQGHEDDKIKELLTLSEDEIRKQINERFQKKNEAIIDSLKVKGQEITKKDDKEISFVQTADDKKEDSDKLIIIQNKLKKSTENFTQLVHFNNIVSGYLGIKTEGSEKVSKNINSIKRELSGIAEDLDPSGGKNNEAYKTVLDSTIKKTQILKQENSSDQEGTGAEMGVDNINKVLEYQKKKIP